MSQKLETFIKENKKAFEENGPSDALWQRIAHGLDEQEKLDEKEKLGASKKVTRPKGFGFYRWLNVAALLILSTAVYLTLRSRQQVGIAVADVNPGMAKEQVHFATLIEEKKDSLEIYSHNNPELYQQFTKDLQHLDMDYEMLKKQLQNSPNREAVVQAMLENLEIRANMLSQQLQIIQQVNQYKTETSQSI